MGCTICECLDPQVELADASLQGSEFQLQPTVGCDSGVCHGDKTRPQKSILWTSIALESSSWISSQVIGMLANKEFTSRVSGGSGADNGLFSFLRCSFFFSEGGRMGEGRRGSGKEVMEDEIFCYVLTSCLHHDGAPGLGNALCFLALSSD